MLTPAPRTLRVYVFVCFARTHYSDLAPTGVPPSQYMTGTHSANTSSLVLCSDRACLEEIASASGALTYTLQSWKEDSYKELC